MEFKHKKIQTIINTDRKYLVSGFSSIGVSQAFSAFAAFITAYFFANYMQKEMYGNYQLVLILLGVMSIFTLRGVAKQIIKERVRTGESILINKTLKLIKYTFPISVIGLTSSIVLYDLGKADLAFSVITISLFLPFLRALTLYQSELLAAHKFKKRAICSFFQFSTPSFFIILAILAHAKLPLLILIYCISHTTTLLILYLYVLYSEKIPLTNTGAPVSSDLHLSFNESILEIGKISDRLIVFALLGPVSFASYMLALLPVREMMRLPQGLRALLLPKFAQYTYQQVLSKVYQKTLVIFLLFSCITVTYIMAAPLLFNLFFPLYQESILYTQLLSLLFPFSSIMVLTQMLTVFDKVKILYIINISSSVIKILLIILGIIYYGIYGAIFGTILANLFRFLITIILVVRN